MLGGEMSPRFRTWGILTSCPSARAEGFAFMSAEEISRVGSEDLEAPLSRLAVRKALGWLRDVGLVSSTRRGLYRTGSGPDGKRWVRSDTRRELRVSLDSAGTLVVARGHAGVFDALAERAERIRSGRAERARKLRSRATIGGSQGAGARGAAGRSAQMRDHEGSTPRNELTIGGAQSEISSDLRSEISPSGGSQRSPAAASFIPSDPEERVTHYPSIPTVKIPPIPRLPERCTDAELVEAAIRGVNAAIRKVFRGSQRPYTVPVKRSVRAHKKNPRPGSWVCDPLPRSAQRPSKTGDAFEAVLTWAKIARAADVRPALWGLHVLEQWASKLKGSLPPLRTVFGVERLRKEIGWYQSTRGSGISTLVARPPTASGRLVYELRLRGELTRGKLAELTAAAHAEVAAENERIALRVERGEWVWGL